DQGLWRGAGGRIVAGGIVVSAEDADAFGDDIPVRRDLDFAATEESGSFENGGFAGDVGTAEVDVVATEGGEETASGEVAVGQVAFRASKDIEAVEASAGREVLGADGGKISLEEESEAAGDDEQGPELIDAVRKMAEVVGEQEDADEGEHASPNALADGGGFEDFAEADEHQCERPETPYCVDVEEPELREEQHDTDADDDHAGDHAALRSSTTGRHCRSPFRTRTCFILYSSRSKSRTMPVPMSNSGQR